MKTLSNPQKSRLAQVARRAFDHLRSKGQLIGIDFDTWRHDECERAVGKHGFRQCGNADYNRLLAHFESLAGEDGRAMEALLRDQSEPKRQAEAILVDVLQKAGLPPAYAEKIARDKFSGRSVLDLDARECWQVVYTLKNRIRARAKADSTI